jgi:hypothetical protein
MKRLLVWVKLAFWFNWVGLGFVVGYLAIDLAHGDFGPSRTTLVLIEVVLLSWLLWRWMGLRATGERISRSIFWWGSTFLGLSLARDLALAYVPGWKECVVMGTAAGAVWVSTVFLAAVGTTTVGR